MNDITALRREFEGWADNAILSVGMIDDILSGRQELPLDIAARDACDGWVVNLRKRLDDLREITRQIEEVVSRV